MKPGIKEFVTAARRVFAALLLVLCAATGMQTAHAATINVPAQYAAIQDAVDAASNGDTIVIANGTYTGAKNRDINIVGKDLVVRSSGGASKCIIDCQQAGRGFYLGIVTGATRIDGFTIKNGMVSNYGGAAFIISGNPVFANCAFTGNSAEIFGGAMNGGTATNCVFTNNATFASGGGGAGMYGGMAINCAFSNNTTNSSGFGGGMNSGTATNCIFTGNVADYGGGMSGGKAIHCTFTGNSSGLDSCTAFNCIIWGNTGASISFSGGTVQYSDVQGGYTGKGNINADPLFVNASAGDFHLTAGSPCINAGSSTAPTGFTLPATDFDGKNRIVGSAPDIGAYEYGNTTPPPTTHNLIWQNSAGGTVNYWTMNTTTFVSSGTIATGIPANWKIVTVADLTGDGVADLIWQNTATGDYAYWQMNGTQRVGSGSLAVGIPLNWKLAGVADVTGDGKNDLVWQNTTSGDVAYWQMNGVNYVSSGSITSGIPSNWKIVSVADITGDGKADLLWENVITGDYAYWQMNGPVYLGSGSIASGIPLNWQIDAVGDLTGDGKADLLWQNAAVGNFYYWQMNGPTLQTSGSLASGIPLSWKIVGIQ